MMAETRAEPKIPQSKKEVAAPITKIYIIHEKYTVSVTPKVTRNGEMLLPRQTTMSRIML